MKQKTGLLIGAAGLLLLVVMAITPNTSDSVVLAISLAGVGLLTLGTIVTGKQKGRLGLGILLSFLLLPGFIIMLVVPPNRDNIPNATRIYEGLVGLVGAGTWRPQAGGVTMRAVLEIGDHHLKNVGVTDYLGNYIAPGKEIRVLMSYPILGLFTKPYIVAVEVDGKKYKEAVAHVILIKVSLYALAVAICTAPFIGIMWLGVMQGASPHPKMAMAVLIGLISINVLVWICLIGYFANNCRRLSRF